MQELRFIGTDDEEDALIVSDETGARYRILVDEALRDALRPRPAHRTEAPRVPPREIQQLIRAGHTVEDVVRMTGAEREDVERFEGPVRAEREYIVAQARQVAVRVVPDEEAAGPDSGSFGDVLDERLAGLEAEEVVWDAWKDPEHGWRVSLEFRAGEIARDAMWAFDPRSQALSPLNASATALSQLHDPSPLQTAPRLRAVSSVEEQGAQAAAEAFPEPAQEPAPTNWLGAAVTEIGSAGRGRRDETADLLEALRRRRGERNTSRYEELPDEDLDESFGEPGPHTFPIGTVPRPVTEADRAAAEEEAAEEEARLRAARDAHPSTGGLRLRPAPEPVERDEEQFGEAEADPEGAAGPHAFGQHRGGAAPGQRPASHRGPRRGRPAMPSWDEIVFGTRPDDER